MLFSVLSKKLNRESLTKNLITFNLNISGLTEIRGGRSTRIKKGRGWTVFRLKGERVCYAMTLANQLTPKQKKKNSDNDCMTTEFYKNVYEMNNFRLRILQNK